MTDEQRAYLLEHINDRPRTEVAKAVGLSVWTVWKFARENGGEMLYRHSDSYMQIVIDNYRNMSGREIVRRFGITRRNMALPLHRLTKIKYLEIMNKKQLFSILDIEDMMYMPDRIMSILFGDKAERDRIYHELIEVNDYDLSSDWFLKIYMEEMAERKKKGQVLSIPDVSELCAHIVDCSEGTLHEPTAGSGSLIIADWWNRCRKLTPWEYFPSKNMVTCWELSSRSLPILLLNLSIRGIMGYVYHGDVLENEVKQKYILLNKRDDSLGFSDVIKANINDIIKEEV